MRTHPWVPLGFSLLAAACGDGGGSAGGDAGVLYDGRVAVDSGAAPDGALPDAVPFVAPTPFALPLSVAGPDLLYTAAPGPAGSFYAVGFSAATLAGDKEIVVLKLTAAGLDTTWGGGDGWVSTGLVFKGGSDEIDVVVQSTGHIIVSATVANVAQPLDTDIALVRLDASGLVDEDFGDEGVRVLDLATAIIDGTTATGGDRVRGLALDATDRIYVHGLQLGQGLFEGVPRTDTDFVLLRLTADGADDASFAGGKYVLDIRGQAPDLIPSSATPRGVHVLADGSVIAGGYATTDGLGPNAQPVLYKLDDVGVPITAFAANGLFHEAVLSTQTEVYNFAVHGTNIVTAGYGRETGELNDWVSLRFDVATGERDLTWGGATNGTVVIDPTGTGVADNCRNAVALPGGKTLLMGSSGPNNDPAMNAVYGILDATGHLDTAYGTGVHVATFGDVAGNEQLWGAAVSGSNVLLVGYRGAGAAAAQTATANDDAYAIVLPLAP